MKTTAALIAKWDTLEDSIRVLEWARNAFLKAQLSASVAWLKPACGFNEASSQVQEAWTQFEREYSVRDVAATLLEIKLAGATVEDFVNALAANSNPLEALMSMNPRSSKPPTSPSDFPGTWRN
jgi:hypothetical protein